MTSKKKLLCFSPVRFLGSAKVPLRDLATGQVRSLPSRNLALVNESGQSIGVSSTHLEKASMRKWHERWISVLFSSRVPSTSQLATILRPMLHQTSMTLMQEMPQQMLVLLFKKNLIHKSGDVMHQKPSLWPVTCVVCLLLVSRWRGGWWNFAGRGSQWLRWGPVVGP